GMDLRRAGLVITEEERKPDAIFIGETDPATVRPTAPIVHQGEGHLVTIASTGAGKGQRFILPTLMTYEGPVVCLDPKGENYRTTKGHRDLMGGVFKWAPFDRNGDTDSFNPLDAIEDWDDARVVADLLIAPSDSGEKRFWDQSARDFVRGLIMYVKTLEPERRTMREVVRILYASDEEHEDLRERLAESDDDMLVELANQFGVMADNMFRSILQSARAELDGWRSKQIADATSTTSENWDISYFVVSLRTQELLATTDETIGHIGYRAGQYSDGTGSMVRGGAYSVFFVIPPDRMRSYASVLRVLLGVHLNAWSRAESVQEEEMAEYDVPYQVPALFVFDELAQLGHMPIVEDQIAIARSARIRMWLIAQDLPQLKRTYPRWESMLGNCRTQIFFGVNDLETATYVSNRAGDKTTVYEETRPLVTPTELMGPTFANKSVIFARGAPPIQAHLPPPFHQEEAMRSIERFLEQWGATLPRRERPEERPVAPEEADEDEPVDEIEVVEDLADGEDEGRGSGQTERDSSSAAVTGGEEVPVAETSNSASDQADQQVAAREAPPSAGEQAEALQDEVGDAVQATRTDAGGARKKRPRKPAAQKPASNTKTPPARRKPRPRKRPEPSSKDE
ncbi:type IV secretory system conjugative DNA transfer family protein, partial [Amorphus sp. MBR-141]